MIQRIQSVFLLLTAVVTVVLFYIPVFELPAAGGAEPREFMITSNALLMVLCGATGVLALGNIFVYRKRQIQLRICRIILIIIFIMIGLLFYTSDTISNGLDQKIIFKIGTYLPLLQVIFVFLAHRSIKKDDELVRSADRLR